MLPPDRPVDCPCDPQLVRRVLLVMTPTQAVVHACLRCGTVTVTTFVVEEPHPHDVQTVGHEIVPVVDAALRWLAAWPRCAGPAYENDWFFLPASLRYDTFAELQAAAAAARAAQAGLTRKQRLLLAGVPSQPPPALPRDVRCFAEIHEVLFAPIPDAAALQALRARLPFGCCVLEDAPAAGLVT